MRLRDYLDRSPRGTGTELALSIGVHRVLVSQWATGVRPVPAEHCPAIERATAGKVTCEGLRPDVRWHRVRERKWPHPAGRPFIDVAREAA